MKKSELIEFSNKRKWTKNPFKDYDDYIDYQINKGLSFESKNTGWREGQESCIKEYFKDEDRNLKILDVCCGDGAGLNYFKGMGFKNVVGVEISDQKIEKAKHSGFKVIKKDICCEPFENNEKYDIILSSHTLEHLLNPLYTLQNLGNILEEGGYIILVLPYPDKGGADPRNDHRFKVHCGVIPLGLHYSDKGKTATQLIYEAGFDIISTKFGSQRESEIHFVLNKRK